MFDVPYDQDMTLLRLLDELDDLRRRVSMHSAPSGRASDFEVLRNFAALAQFANPECLPTFERRIPGGRVVKPAQPARPVPDGIPYPRHPRDAT